MLEDRQKTIKILSNQNLEKYISQFVGKDVFAICYGDNQMIIPTEMNLVAKRSSQDSSISSIFYSDEEIISTNESTLEIKLKTIGKVSIIFIYLFFYFYRFWLQRFSKSQVQ